MYFVIMIIEADEVQKRFLSFEPQLIQDIVEVAEIRVFDKGAHILRKGRYINSMLLILDGLVKVFKYNGNGNKFLIHYLKSGESFAVTMINDNQQEPSEVTAVAFEKTVLLSIPLSCMDKWMYTHKSWYRYVFGTFRYRAHLLFDAINSLAFLSTNERLIRYLKSHEEVLNSNNIPITRTDIAKEMNSSREVVTRLLKKLASSGKIKMHRQYVEIIDLQ